MCVKIKKTVCQFVARNRFDDHVAAKELDLLATADGAGECIAVRRFLGGELAAVREILFEFRHLLALSHVCVAGLVGGCLHDQVLFDGDASAGSTLRRLPLVLVGGFAIILLLIAVLALIRTIH